MVACRAVTQTTASAGPGPLTVRCVIAGVVLAVVLCAMNSYLTLSFGVIEEGPTIAALFFFAVFFLSRTKISVTEMVIVATMGSAGGSFGFIANFFAAKAMTGTPYTVPQMIAFGLVSSVVGLMLVVPLRDILIRKANLPWPGSKATESVIRALIEHGDPKQPLYLAISFVFMCAYVVLNKEDGFGWFPFEIALGGLVAYGGALSLAPFALGGSYLMGLRTCVGFGAAAVVLILFGRYLPPETLPTPDAPQKFVWPGLGFLTASGLTLVFVNWRAMVDSIGALVRPNRGASADVDDDPIMSARAFGLWVVGSLALTIAVLVLVFDLPILIILALLAVGGFVQNMIATRAQAQTAFNPARVMGILCEGLCWLLGGKAPAISLTGAGFVAGCGGQAGNLTGDMAYGRPLKVKSSWQYTTQTLTVIPCTIVAAVVFQWISKQKEMTLDTAAIAAPTAKIWAATALIFEGKLPMVAGALKGLWIGAVAGVLYTILEQNEKLRRVLPCSVGLGIGLVLPPAYGLAFFLGGFLFWVVLGQWLKVREVTLTTISVAAVVAEGIGGVAKALLAAAGVL